jgi:hypothetical protein
MEERSYILLPYAWLKKRLSFFNRFELWLFGNTFAVFEGQHMLITRNGKARYVRISGEWAKLSLDYLLKTSPLVPA